MLSFLAQPFIQPNSVPVDAAQFLPSCNRLFHSLARAGRPAQAPRVGGDRAVPLHDARHGGEDGGRTGEDRGEEERAR